MSFTTVLFPIVAALIAPEGKFFEKNALWSAVNTQQEWFLKNIYTEPTKKELFLFNDKELRCWVSQSHKELNKIAKENGFTIQLLPFSKSEFGSLSILDVAVQWKTEGKETSINIEDKAYKAAKLEKEFQVFESSDYEHSIVQIKTKTNDVVNITIADEKLESFKLLEKVNNLKKFINQENLTKYASVIFPFVKLDQQVDISWLLGMKEKGYSISQALQQTKFNMDHKGARVESAVAIAFEKCIRFEKKCVIDKPFYVWIERPGCSMPIFSGYIDMENWVKAN